MQCEILHAFSGVMGSYSVGEVADVADEWVPELSKLGWLKPVGKAPKTRKATKEKGSVPNGEGD